MLRRMLLGLFLLVLVSTISWAQMSMPGTQIQEVKPVTQTPQVSLTLSTPEQLETRADELRDVKDYLGALDYLEAAMKKRPTAVVQNKIGMCYISMGNWNKARKSLQKAIKMDKQYAEAYNNLGVAFYRDKKYGQAEKNYRKALAIRESASFYSNLGTLQMEKKEYEKGMASYTKAFELDPEIFERTSRTGISARMSSPEDRARFFYLLARLYASKGEAEKSLLYLKKAMEDGFADIENVYKDAEFATLRKDQRFTELMAQRPTAIPQ